MRRPNSPVNITDDSTLDELRLIYEKLSNSIADPALNTKQLLGAIANLVQPPSSGSEPLPVLIEYPVTDPTKAGQRFWYKGHEWHWMTQAEIDSTGWAGLVEVGFPAPVSKSYLPEVIGASIPGPAGGYIVDVGYSSTYNILGFGHFATMLKIVPLSYGPLQNKFTKVINAQLLKSVENVGTSTAINFSGQSYALNADEINNFFEQLPSTQKNATVRLTGQPGAATCNPSIATAKGYAVVT